MRAFVYVLLIVLVACGVLPAIGAAACLAEECADVSESRPVAPAPGAPARPQVVGRCRRPTRATLAPPGRAQARPSTTLAQDLRRPLRS